MPHSGAASYCCLPMLPPYSIYYYIHTTIRKTSCSYTLDPEVLILIRQLSNNLAKVQLQFSFNFRRAVESFIFLIKSEEGDVDDGENKIEIWSVKTEAEVDHITQY